MMTLWQAIILGIIEGLTEFVPVSSTGHLILAAHALRMTGEAIKTFEVVIQAGAMVAVVGLYWDRLVSLVRGAMRADPSGLRLLQNLLISFLPIAVVGLLFRAWIKTTLFGAGPVVIALAVGGLVMIVLDRPLHQRPTTRGIGTLTSRDALVIGLAQCCALWPGTSRAMVTILAGMAVGLPAAMAAEYSFLLALPSLGAAALLDAVKGGPLLVQQAGWVLVVGGFLVAMVVAGLTIRGFLSYLQNHGLAMFGWYRLGLAAAVWFFLLRL